jgi:hypothetical protein
MQIPASPRTEQLLADLMATGRYRDRGQLFEAALEALAASESFELIRAELDEASERLVTPELAHVEDQAIEELAQRIQALDDTSRG